MLRRRVTAKGAQKPCLRPLHPGKNRHIQGLSSGIHGILVYVLIADIVSDPQQPNCSFLHPCLLRSSLLSQQRTKTLYVIIRHYIMTRKNFNSFLKIPSLFLCHLQNAVSPAYRTFSLLSYYA